MFNILYIHHGAGHGGVQNNLARFWTAMDREAFQPHLAYSEEGLLSARAVELGIPHLRLPLPAWRKLIDRLRMGACLKQLAEYGRRHHVRLVVANDFWYAPHAIRAAERMGVPSLVYVRLSDILTEEKIHQYLLPRATGLLVPSHAYARPLLALPETAAKTRVIPNGIDTEYFAPGAALEPVRLPWPGEPLFIVGNTGTISEVKGQETLLSAARLLLDRGVPVRVLLAGGAREELLSALRQRHAALFESGVVHHAQRARDVRAWLSHMHVFAMTSYRESFGLAMAEAMAMGLPVVYAETGGPAEIAHQAGLPYRPGDVDALAAQLQHLHQHPEERAHLGVLARRRIVEHYPLSAQVEATERFYRALLSTPGS